MAMSYSPEVYKKISEIYEERRRTAIRDLEARIEHAGRVSPEIAEIEKVLGSTGVRIMEAVRRNDGGASFDAVRKENEELVAKREELLVQNGFPRDYCSPRCLCPLCGDTGFVEGRQCACMKEALYEAQAALSGLGALLGKQTFENFSLDYYTDKSEARTARSYCEKFAREGVINGENLLLMGGTGMGKTHLSTAIADVVMKNGGSVIYESAPHVFDDFRFEQFGRGWNDRTPVRTDKYFSADLVIVDDLGSEMIGSFSVSVLYNLLNTRLNDRKSMLFSTNFSQKELMTSYDRRIVSRILSSFKVFALEGEDIRMQKQKGR